MKFDAERARELGEDEHLDEALGEEGEEGEEDGDRFFEQVDELVYGIRGDRMKQEVLRFLYICVCISTASQPPYCVQRRAAARVRTRRDHAGSNSRWTSFCVNAWYGLEGTGCSRSTVSCITPQNIICSWLSLPFFPLSLLDNSANSYLFRTAKVRNMMAAVPSTTLAGHTPCAVRR